MTSDVYRSSLAKQPSFEKDLDPLKKEDATKAQIVNEQKIDIINWHRQPITVLKMDQLVDLKQSIINSAVEQSINPEINDRDIRNKLIKALALQEAIKILETK